MDEGVGVYAAKFLEENFTIDAQIVDGGTLGFKLMGYYQEYDKVIILDTVSIEDEPGSVYNLPGDVLLGLGSYRKTAHEVEVVEMLEICSLLEHHAQVNIIGIVPADIESVGIDLTPTLKSSFHALIAETLKELDRAGISYERRGHVGLDHIIKTYAEGKMDRSHGL